MKKQIRHMELHPAKTLAIGFAGMILIGTLLLSLPMVTQTDRGVGFIDALFTATSAVCVTGLTTLTTSDTWNFWGQLIILILIQIGGLGIMSTATIGVFITGARFSLSDRFALKESMDEVSYSGVIRLAKAILLLTLLIETLGAIILGVSFVPRYGLAKGIWMSIFHSISAFCNAGFDIIGAESLKPFQTSGWITLTLASLVIVGGLGFSVLTDLQQYPRKRSLKLHSRFVLLMTVLLIVFGMIIILGAEYDNPLTLGPMSLLDKLENAFFQSITPRTAGFSAIDQGNLTSQSQGLTMLLMFIGGSPGSTAGGIKTVTFGLLIATVISVVRGRDDTEIFHRRISNRLVNRAIAVMVISLGVIVIPILILVTLNPHLPSSQIMFETMSAYGTVGLSTGITVMFSEISKFILIITMFIGRVGPLTVLFALAERARSKNQLRYPEGRIHIG